MEYHLRIFFHNTCDCDNIRRSRSWWTKSMDICEHALIVGTESRVPFSVRSGLASAVCHTLYVDNHRTQVLSRSIPSRTHVLAQLDHSSRCGRRSDIYLISFPAPAASQRFDSTSSTFKTLPQHHSCRYGRRPNLANSCVRCMIEALDQVETGYKGH